MIGNKNIGQLKHCGNCNKVEAFKEKLTKEEADWYMGEDRRDKEIYLCSECYLDYKREKKVALSEVKKGG